MLWCQHYHQKLLILPGVTYTLRVAIPVRERKEWQIKVIFELWKPFLAFKWSLDTTYTLLELRKKNNSLCVNKIKQYST